MDEQDSKPVTRSDAAARGSWLRTGVWLLAVAWFGVTLVAAVRLIGSPGVPLTALGLALVVVFALGLLGVARTPVGTGASILAGTMVFPAWSAPEEMVATTGVFGFVVVMGLLPALSPRGGRRQRIVLGVVCMASAVFVLALVAVGLRQLGADGDVLPLLGPAGRLLLWAVEGLPRLG
jgi:hypothetical protein